MDGMGKKIPCGLMVSAPRKSSGKTTLTLGLSAAMMERDRIVRVFKKGPDYIDPMWHKAVTGFPCYNIDPYWMDEPLCRSIFGGHCSAADLNLVEGNHGLHDGMDLAGGNSSADLAKTLGIPVLLVVDGSGMNRGAAALVLGQQLLDRDLTIAGVILNQVGSSRQIEKQTRAIEHYCGIPVLGALPRTDGLQIKERHLGLMTVHEVSLARRVVSAAAETVRKHCDLERIWKAAGRVVCTGTDPIAESRTEPDIRIGVAADKAFCFYYEHNLAALRSAGAELVYFDTLADTCLPEVDGVYIGGGFPESFLQTLAENKVLRRELRERIEEGLPVYAECGGLMYLTRSIIREGKSYPMVGAIPADTLFVGRPVGKGYAEMETRPGVSWLDIPRPIKGHEFHYSQLVDLGADIEYVFRMKRGTGIVDGLDGLVRHHLIASYTHIHACVVPEWSREFVGFARKLRFSQRSA